MAGPLEQYKSLQASSDFLFTVFYRGAWCPFCLQYLKTLESIRESVQSAGGKTVIITAEPQEAHEVTLSKTGYKGEAIVDRENIIAKEVKSQGLVNVAISDKGGYPHGMAQPAVLIMTREGQVLYNWAIVPALSNIGGAKDRPSLVQIWADVKAEMDGQASVYNGMYAKQTLMMGLKTKIFG